MSRIRRIAAFFLLPASALAQLTASSPAEANPTFRTNARLVYVDIVVRDAHGNVVRGLTQQDFRLFEDVRRASSLPPISGITMSVIKSSTGFAPGGHRSEEKSVHE